MEHPPQYKMVEEPPKRGRGVTYMVIAGCVGLVALLGLLSGVNAVLYLMGAGTEVEVTVTESSTESRYHEISGKGHYEQDGEITDVRLTYVDAGETVTARTAIIPVPFYFSSAYVGQTAAFDDLRLLIGVLMISLLAARLFMRGRGHYNGTIRVTRRYFLRNR